VLKDAQIIVPQTGRIRKLQGQQVHYFLKFLQYEDFSAYVNMEPGSLHQDFRKVGWVPC